MLGSINLEPISSQIERLGIDCHLCQELLQLLTIHMEIREVCRPRNVPLFRLSFSAPGFAIDPALSPLATAGPPYTLFLLGI